MYNVVKRTRNIDRFKMVDGSTIVLIEGSNMLSDNNYNMLVGHPMFEDMVKISSLLVEKVEDQNDNAELSQDDLETKSKQELSQLAQSYNIDVTGLNKSQIIEALKQVA